MDIDKDVPAPVWTPPAPLRRITSERLREVVEAHELWLASGGAAGVHGDLSRTDLKKLEIGLRDLRQASFHDSDLQGFVLNGSRLDEADLSGANLFHASLAGTSLRGANLARANLRGATLVHADCRGANLLGACLQEAHLHETRFQDASLRDVDATETEGLSADALGGADVTAAKLPDAIEKFQTVEQVKDGSASARTLFFLLLAAGAYAALTIFSTTDGRLLTNSATSRLPIIDTEIPIVGFFVLAPVVVLAVFLYFQLSLQRLWESLSRLPAIFSDGRPLDQRIFPWLVTGVVRTHLPRLRHDRPALSRLQAAIVTLLVWWTVPLVLALFWLRYLPRHDWVGTIAHVVALSLGVASAAWFQQTAIHTLRHGQRPAAEGSLGRLWRWSPGIIAAATLLIVAVVSDGAINGVFRQDPMGPFLPDCRMVLPWRPVDAATMPAAWRPHRILVPHLLPCLGLRAFADVSEQEVSRRLPNPTGATPPPAVGADLQHADLGFASAPSAFLVSANLRAARLAWTTLVGAQLQRADLFGADLRRTKLFSANLSGARAEQARIHLTNLTAATLDGAALCGARLTDVLMEKASLVGARLSNAAIDGAWLSDANLSHADFTRVTFTGSVDFEGAKLRGADFRGTRGLSEDELKAASDWKDAFYDPRMLQRLGLPDRHNEDLESRLQKERPARPVCRETIRGRPYER